MGHPSGIIRSILAAVVLAGLSAFAGCDGRPTPPSLSSPAKPTDNPTNARNVKASSRVVIASFYPVAYFADRIAQGHADIRTPCPPDADPAAWNPDRSDIEAMQAASLVLINGAEFESWRSSTSLPESRVVDTTAALKSELIHGEVVRHSHGPAGEHSHGGIDGHTWLDPINAIAQAKAVLDAFVRTWPDDRAHFQAGFDALASDLAGLDASLRALAPAAQRATILANHPAYGYLAKRHGWTVSNLDISPDESPSPAQWKAVAEAVERAPSDRPRLMLFEADPLPATVERLARQWNIRAVVFSPCESRQDAADYIARMRANIDRLAASLGATSAASLQAAPEPLR